MPHYDTVILGAGWAGATAAKSLTARGHSVLVLEARNRIGGRASTWQGAGARIDVGCSWIHGYNEGSPVRDLAEEIGVEAVLPREAQGVIYGPDGPLSAAEAGALQKGLGESVAAAQLPHPAPPSSQSLASAILAPDSALFTSSDKALATSLARSLEVGLGVRLEQASLKWAGWESTTAYAGSDAAPEGGYQAFLEKVLEASKAEVVLNAAATSIKEIDSGVQVTTRDGKTYTASTVLCTIPLGVLKTLPNDFFSPALPAHRQETIQGTHVGVLEKLLIQYPSAWWPGAANTGSYTFLPTGPQPSAGSSLEEVFAGSTLVTANFAAPVLPNPTATLLTYLSETPARLLLQHPAKDVAAAFHSFLLTRFNASSPPEPSNYTLTSWLTDPLSLGATTTPSIVSPSDERSPMDFKELGRPVWAGRLGFAGEHTEMENRGSVAGAVLSGRREGERISRFLRLHKA